MRRRYGEFYRTEHVLSSNRKVNFILWPRKTVAQSILSGSASSLRRSARVEEGAGRPGDESVKAAREGNEREVVGDPLPAGPPHLLGSIRPAAEPGRGINGLATQMVEPTETDSGADSDRAERDPQSTNGR